MAFESELRDSCVFTNKDSDEEDDSKVSKCEILVDISQDEPDQWEDVKVEKEVKKRYPRRKKRTKEVDDDDEYTPPYPRRKSSRYCTSKGSEEKLHSCKICGRGYLHDINLKVHMKEHEVPEELHRCDICGRNMGSKQSLKEHKRNHSTPRTNCHYCKLNFDSTLELSKHQALNKCIKQYACDACGQLFMREYGLQQHQKACNEKVRLSSLCSDGDETLSGKLFVDEGAQSKNVCKTYSRKKKNDAQDKPKDSTCSSKDLFILST